jgi:hypothetical protein
MTIENRKSIGKMNKKSQFFEKVKKIITGFNEYYQMKESNLKRLHTI